MRIVFLVVMTLLALGSYLSQKNPSAMVTGPGGGPQPPTCPLANCAAN